MKSASPCSDRETYSKMQWLSNLKLSQKLVGSLMLCAFVTAIVGTVGVLKVREVTTMQTEMYDREFIPVRQDGTAAWQAASHFRRLYSYILNPEAAGRAELPADPDQPGPHQQRPVR